MDNNLLLILLEKYKHRLKGKWVTAFLDVGFAEAW
jgi:hypothetical protein